jgi:phage portal protein BeeE
MRPKFVVWEQALNAALMSDQMRRRFYFEFNIDGLLRGDFKTRMEGLARAVQTSILTPDEARSLENRPAKGGNADKLFMQGATMPIDAPQPEPIAPDPIAPDPNEGDQIDGT